MTEIYLHFIFANDGLYGNAPLIYNIWGADADFERAFVPSNRAYFVLRVLPGAPLPQPQIYPDPGR